MEAIRQATRLGVTPHCVLLSSGVMAEADYVGALAAYLGLGICGPHEAVRLAVPDDEPVSAPTLARYTAPPGAGAGSGIVVLDGTAHRPTKLAQLVATRALGATRFALATPATMRAAVLRCRAEALAEGAAGGLYRKNPAMSASSGLSYAQILGLAVIAGLEIGGFLVVPGAAVIALTALLTLPFLIIVVSRVVAFAALIRAPVARTPLAGPRRPPPDPAGDRDPAHYTVLCPLYCEAAMLPQLVGALLRLDYPVARLEILLLLEAVDGETRRAAANMTLPAHFRVVIVPDRGPRTKPKALDYGLQFARGDYVVVYDAEDIPEPDQLRKALARFRAGGDDLACVQARLMIHNPRDGWLARQFAIEYLALFDALLPTFERLGLALPLGGTSNHFPVEVLRRVGGWDPHNMTEDADLGVRLARYGYRSRMLASTTYEEAPARFGEWLKQRTRWLKGWFQTYIVHTRRPIRLLRDLGLWGFIGFHAIIGGLILSALVHPVFYGLIVWAHFNGGWLAWPETTAGFALWSVALINIVVGYLAAITLGFAAAARRGRWRLALRALLIPPYWLLISLAAYRALFQLFTAPFMWEKTAHGACGPLHDEHGHAIALAGHRRQADGRSRQVSRKHHGSGGPG